MQAVNNRRGQVYFYMVMEALKKLSHGELYQVHCVRIKKLFLLFLKVGWHRYYFQVEGQHIQSSKFLCQHLITLLATLIKIVSIHRYWYKRIIIWDEARMSHKNCFEALDKTLKDVMSSQGLRNIIFGGKVVVLGEDFRQILLVVLRGGRSNIVHTSIWSSYVWDYCQVLTLTKNMRLQQGSGTQNEL